MFRSAVSALLILTSLTTCSAPAYALRASGVEAEEQQENLRAALLAAAGTEGIFPQTSIPAVVTPFKLLSRDPWKVVVDRDSVRTYFQHLKRIGVKAILAVGTTGEFFAMDKTLRQSAIEILTYEAKQAGLIVFTNITGDSPEEVVENAGIAYRAGADAFVDIPLYYLENPAEIDSHIRELMRQLRDVEKIDRPLVLYNIPMLHKQKGQHIPAAVVSALVTDGLVAGIKDTSLDINQTQAYIGTGAVVYNGNPLTAAQGMKLGTRGVVSVARSLLREIPDAASADWPAVEAQVAEAVPILVGKDFGHIQSGMKTGLVLVGAIKEVTLAVNDPKKVRPVTPAEAAAILKLHQQGRLAAAGMEQVEPAEAKILVVEDDEMLRNMNLRIVRAAVSRYGIGGTQVFAFASATEAAEWARANHPTLTLTDYNLLNGTGLDVLAAVREEDPSAPVILYSSPPADADPPIPGRFTAFIPKPGSPDDLEKLVAAHLAPRLKQVATLLGDSKEIRLARAEYDLAQAALQGAEAAQAGEDVLGPLRANLESAAGRLRSLGVVPEGRVRLEDLKIGRRLISPDGQLHFVFQTDFLKATLLPVVTEGENPGISFEAEGIVKISSDGQLAGWRFQPTAAGMEQPLADYRKSLEEMDILKLVAEAQKAIGDLESESALRAILPNPIVVDRAKEHIRSARAFNLSARILAREPLLEFLAAVWLAKHPPAAGTEEEVLAKLNRLYYMANEVLALYSKRLPRATPHELYEFLQAFPFLESYRELRYGKAAALDFKETVPNIYWPDSKPQKSDPEDRSFNEELALRIAAAPVLLRELIGWVSSQGIDSDHIETTSFLTGGDVELDIATYLFQDYKLSRPDISRLMEKKELLLRLIGSIKELVGLPAAGTEQSWMGFQPLGGYSEAEIKRDTRIAVIGGGRFLRSALLHRVFGYLNENGIGPRRLAVLLQPQGEHVARALNRDDGKDLIVTAALDSVLREISKIIVGAGSLKPDSRLGVLRSEQETGAQAFLRYAELPIEFLAVGITEGGFKQDNPAIAQAAQFLYRLYQKHPGQHPVSVINTDNVPRNGDKLRALVEGVPLGVQDEALFKKWLGYNVTFHNSAVDTIVVEDPNDQVVPRAEPAPQYLGSFVLEDLKGVFPIQMEEVPGVVILRKPGAINAYLEWKLRIANWAHLVELPWLLSGFTSTRDVAENEVGRALLERNFASAVGPAIQARPELSIKGKVAARFHEEWMTRLENPKITQRLEFIGQNVVQKLVYRSFGTIHDLKTKEGVDWNSTAFSIASILRYLTPVRETKPGEFEGRLEPAGPAPGTYRINPGIKPIYREVSRLLTGLFGKSRSEIEPKLDQVFDLLAQISRDELELEVDFRREINLAFLRKRVVEDYLLLVGEGRAVPDLAAEILSAGTEAETQELVEARAAVSTAQIQAAAALREGDRSGDEIAQIAQINAGNQLARAQASSPAAGVEQDQAALVQRVLAAGRLGVLQQENGRRFAVVPVPASQEPVAMELFVQAGLESPQGIPQTVLVRSYSAGLEAARRQLANNPPLAGAVFLLNNQVVNRQTVPEWVPAGDYRPVLADPRISGQELGQVLLQIVALADWARKNGQVLEINAISFIQTQQGTFAIIQAT